MLVTEEERKREKDEGSWNEVWNEEESEYFARIFRAYALSKHKDVSAREHMRIRTRIHKYGEESEAWPPVEKTLSKSYSIQLMQTSLHNFYERYIPTPCEFELPPGKVNQYLHVDELLSHKEVKASSKFWQHWAAFFFALFFILFFTWRYLKQIRQVNEAAIWAQVKIRAWRTKMFGSDRSHGPNSSRNNSGRTTAAVSAVGTATEAIHREMAVRKTDGLTV